MKRRKGLLDEEKFLPPLPEQLPRGVSSLPGYGQTSPIAQGLLGFTGRQPTYSVMDPEAQKMSEAYRLGEQASVASQLYGSVAPFAVASTMANAQRAGSLLSPLTVFHGSPHKFSKFDASKIGTGEGAQAYGHGIYLAESPAVADSYRSALSSSRTKFDGKPLSALNMLERDAADYVTTYGGKQQALDVLNSKLNAASKFDDLDYLAKVRDRLINANVSVEKGAFYKVDLPDEQIAKMLDWDKPLSQQPEAVQKLAKEYGLTKNASGTGEAKGSYIYQTIANRMAQPPFNEKSPYSSGAPIASDKLKELGIPGIRYLDQGSRGKGGTSNFVVFPGEESKLRIMEVNGKPVVIDEEELRRSGLLGVSALDIKEKVFSQIGSKSLQEPVSINPKYLTFRETDQGRLEQVRELFPKGEPMNPIVTIKEADGSYSILDGHNRAVVAMEREQKIPMVSVTRKEYEDLNQSGFDDMEISFAALTRANQDDAASDLNRQFSGSDVGGRGMKAYAKLPEYGAAVGAGLLSPAVLEYLRRRDEEGM